MIAIEEFEKCCLSFAEDGRYMNDIRGTHESLHCKSFQTLFSPVALNFK